MGHSGQDLLTAAGIHTLSTLNTNPAITRYASARGRHRVVMEFDDGVVLRGGFEFNRCFQSINGGPFTPADVSYVWAVGGSDRIFGDIHVQLAVQRTSANYGCSTKGVRNPVALTPEESAWFLGGRTTHKGEEVRKTIESSTCQLLAIKSIVSKKGFLLVKLQRPANRRHKYHNTNMDPRARFSHRNWEWDVSNPETKILTLAGIGPNGSLIFEYDGKAYNRAYRHEVQGVARSTMSTSYKEHSMVWGNMMRFALKPYFGEWTRFKSPIE